MARQLARSLEDQLGRLRTEARGLAQLTAPRSKSGHAPALDAVSPDKGYGAALAAALGDDLDAALDARAPSYWGGAEATTQVWPDGAQALAPLVKAPAELAARLAFTDRGRTRRRRSAAQDRSSPRQRLRRPGSDPFDATQCTAV